MSKYLGPAMTLGIPRVTGIHYLRAAPGAVSRRMHVQRLLDEGRFAGWLRVAERIDGLATRRTRGSFFATVDARDRFVEVAQAVGTLSLLDEHTGCENVVRELNRAGINIEVDGAEARAELQCQILAATALLFAE